MGMGSQKKGPVSEINVTPLVDVMLVLLVIFMITAPMMMSGIDLKLPKTKKVTSLRADPKLTILSVSAQEAYYLGKVPVKKDQIVKSIIKAFKENKSDTLFLRADYSLKYEKVAKLMATLKKAGITNIALVTEVESL